VNSGLYLLAAALLAWGGWRFTIASLAGLYFLLALLILWVLRPGRSDEAADTASATSAVSLRTVPWGDTRLWLLLASYAGIYAFITSVQLHLHAFLTDLGHTPAAAAQVLSILTLVGAVGAPLFGWYAERTSARRALGVVVVGLAVSSTVLWTAQAWWVFAAWAVAYGLFNSGVVALLALVLNDLFGAQQIGRLMGVAMVFCMSATMAGNNFSAWVFDTCGSYRPAWVTYSAVMLCALVPLARLGRVPSRRP
jgi:MFS family permease